jgi:hypothetical protein
MSKDRDIDDQRFMEMQRQTIKRRAFLLKPLVVRINLFPGQTPTFQTPSLEDADYA